MQVKNFDINPDFSSLTYKNRHFDLHNNFSFIHFNSNNEKEFVELVFKNNKGNWVPENTPDGFTLLFKSVKHIYLKDHDADYRANFIAQDEFTLDMFGFSFVGDEIMDGISDHVPKPNLPALLFILITGKAIKIIADSVELILH